jgi:hypothetical protein
LDFIRSIPKLEHFFFANTESIEAAVNEFLAWIRNTPGAFEKFFTYDVGEMN